MRGFILIEIVIATAIASGIMVVLFTALNQTIRYQTTQDDYVDYYTRATLLDNQFEKDFNGVFVPFQSWPQDNDNKDGKQSKPSEPKKTTESSSAQDLADESEEDKKSPKSTSDDEKNKIKKVFYASQEGKTLEISFITTNAMQVYWGKSLGKPKPRIVRITYRLEPEKDTKDSFKLTRKETEELDYEKAKKDTTRVFELINGIKSLSLEFFGRVSKWNEQTASSQQKKDDEQKLYKKEWEYQTFKKWDSDEMKTLRLFPDYMQMKLVLSDGSGQRDRTFELSFTDIPTITKDKVVWPERSKEEKEKVESAPMPQQLAVEEMMEVTVIKDGKKNKYRAKRCNNNILDMILK